MLKALAQISRRDVFVDGIKWMDAGALLGVDAVRVEGEARATDDDPLGRSEQAIRLIPTRQTEKSVDADEIEESRIGHLQAEFGEDVNRVVGSTVGAGSIEAGGSKTHIGLTGQRGHCEAIFKGSRCSRWLERLAPGRGEENYVEVEVVGSGGGDGDVAAMDGVEAAAEEGYAHR